jgi:hypothetical protein
LHVIYFKKNQNIRRTTYLQFSFCCGDLCNNNQITMKNKKKKGNKLQESNTDSADEGILSMMISLHTFPLESEEELKIKQELVEKLKEDNKLGANN